VNKMTAKKIGVVGSGVVGSSVAYYLAQSGVDVTLIDRGPTGENASGKNAGNLNPLFMSPPALIPLALQSLDLHKRLREELMALGCLSYALEPVKRVLLSMTKDQTNQLQALVDLFSGHKDFSLRSLEKREICKMDSRVSDEFESGLLMLGNMAVDSYLLNINLREAAYRLGARLVRTEVKSIKKTIADTVELDTPLGTFSFDDVVLATGPWGCELEDQVGFALPIEPVKGELLRMKLPDSGIKHDWTHNMISLYKRGRNEVWVGVTKERVGFDSKPTDAGKEFLLKGAIEIMPEMSKASIIEHSATLRPMSKTELPIVDRVPGWNNVYIANGGGSKGTLTCTGIGSALKDLVLHGHKNNISSFHPLVN